MSASLPSINWQAPPIRDHYRANTELNHDKEIADVCAKFVARHGLPTQTHYQPASVAQLLFMVNRVVDKRILSDQSPPIGEEAVNYIFNRLLANHKTPRQSDIVVQAVHDLRAEIKRRHDIRWFLQFELVKKEHLNEALEAREKMLDMEGLHLIAELPGSDCISANTLLRWHQDPDLAPVTADAYLPKACRTNDFLRLPLPGQVRNLMLSRPDAETIRSFSRIAIAELFLYEVRSKFNGAALNVKDGFIPLWVSDLNTVKSSMAEQIDQFPVCVKLLDARLRVQLIYRPLMAMLTRVEKRAPLDLPVAIRSTPAAQVDQELTGVAQMVVEDGVQLLRKAINTADALVSTLNKSTVKGENRNVWSQWMEDSMAEVNLTERAMLQSLSTISQLSAIGAGRRNDVGPRTLLRNENEGGLKEVIEEKRADMSGVASIAIRPMKDYRMLIRSWAGRRDVKLSQDELHTTTTQNLVDYLTSNVLFKKAGVMRTALFGSTLGSTGI